MELTILGLQKGLCTFKGVRKLPQAFMQIERMDNEFRNLTAKVWGNLDNPIKSYELLKFWLISCMPPSVMSQQYNCFSLFMKMPLPSTFILRYVRAKMIVLHLWMNLIKCMDYWSPREFFVWNSMYKVNGELFSCDITITYSGIVPSREGDIENFA